MISPNRRAWQQQTLGIILIVLIAANVFARVLYGDQHPYGRVVTEQSVRAVLTAIRRRLSS